MRRRFANVVAPRAPTQNAIVVHNQRRNAMEAMSAWWLASWCMCWQWNFYTVFPIVAADWLKPAIVYNKIPMLHYFHEKKEENKLAAEMDSTFTMWTEELDRSVIDDAISRTF